MAFLRVVGDWLDERTEWRAWAARWLEHPLVGGSRWASAMAAAVATCFLVLALTGIAMMTAYAPSPQSAWGSVHYIEYVLDRGWIVRGLHYWAAQALLVLAAVHIVHGVVTANYRAPREIMWWLTLSVVALAVGEGITGGLLPWDQLGWWGRTVEGNIVGMAPVLGAFIQQMMIGGSELGALGLARSYTLHVALLPLLLAIVLFVRFKLARRQGWSAVAPSTQRLLSEDRRSAYLRRLALDTLFAAAVVFALLAITTAKHGAPMDAPADPMSDYPARPEWFLLPLFALRKFFHGAGEFYGTTLLPGVAALILVVLPFVDKPPRPRIAAMLPAFAVFAAVGWLGWHAWYKDAHDEQYIKQHAKAEARAAAAVQLAMHGIPPGGALEMVRQDPELRGHDLFEQHCASCHVLGDLGDPKKATATYLDGWGTPQWIEAMMHDPDALQFFGRGPYKGKMPSVDVRPADLAKDKPWKPMIKSEVEKHAVALFLASQSGDTSVDEATRKVAEKIVSERCTTCHFYKGEGDDEDSKEAPELVHYASFAWTRAQIANPATPATYREEALDEKLKKHMPAYEKDLSAADIDTVARWTRSRARATTVR
jgi:ubiquinol-cytochrome c reductase cytochrome b subunit